tara:strand:+ start:170647 stop:171051 length:405 start_codon:yes stop_codon:yes gene_type:complete
MPVKYNFNTTTWTIDIVCSGELTIDEILQYFSDIYADDSIQQGAVEMVDLSCVTYFNVNYKEAPQMPATYIPAHERKKIKATFLFGQSDTNLGIAELIRAHFNKTMPEHDFRVFPEKSAALEEAKKIIDKKIAL